MPNGACVRVCVCACVCRCNATRFPCKVTVGEIESRAGRPCWSPISRFRWQACRSPSRAYDSLEAGKLAEAERAYQQILQANGHDAEVWYQLGDTVLGQGRRAEAAERFRQALELQPDHVVARAGLGVTLASMRKLRRQQTDGADIYILDNSASNPKVWRFSQGASWTGIVDKKDKKESTGNPACPLLALQRSFELAGIEICVLLQVEAGGGSADQSPGHLHSSGDTSVLETSSARSDG